MEQNEISEAIQSERLRSARARPIFNRIWNYYSSVSNVLAGNSEMAAIFPNTTDIGMQREWAYAQFLKNHLPSLCNVFFGGLIFSADGNESRQMDVIVTSNLVQRFFSPDGGKSIASVDGTIAAVSLKSTLNTAELHDALENIASIPNLMFNPADENATEFEKLPVKIIYAPRGMRPMTLFTEIERFYTNHPELPFRSRPDLIHVNQSCVFQKVRDQASQYLPLQDTDGAFGLLQAVYLIQDRLLTSLKLDIAYMQTIAPLIAANNLLIIEDS